MSKQNFLAAHDPKVKYPAAIRKVFAELRKSEGADAWRYEQPLSQLSGVALVYIQKLRTSAEFAPHVVETPRTNGRNIKYGWFVDVKVAAEVRAQLKKSL